jgi:hypothetical protein
MICRWPRSSTANAADESLRSIAVHGVTIMDRTASRQVIALETKLLSGGLLVDTRTIPGELVTFTRDVAFIGITVGGDAVPAGTYMVVVDASDADTELAYRVEGWMIDWQPAN